MDAALRHSNKPKLDLCRIYIPTVREMRKQFLAALCNEAKVAGNTVVPLRRVKPAHMFLFNSRKDE
jgi:hypothetical protein